MPDEVTRETVLPAEPAEVWRALTEPERLAAVAGRRGRHRAAARRRAGRAHRGRRGPHGLGGGGAAPSRLTFWWSADGDEESTRVQLDLEEADDGATRLRVTESRRSPGSRSAAGGPQMLATA